MIDREMIEEVESRPSERYRLYTWPVRLVGEKLYLELLEQIEDLENENAGLQEENEALKERLAKTEGGYYLVDAKEWGAKYNALNRSYQEEAAKVYGLQMRIDFLEETVEHYKKLLKIAPDQEAKTYYRDESTGQFTPSPVRSAEPAAVEAVPEEPEEPEAAAVEQEAENPWPVQKIKVTKAMKAFSMNERGAKKEVIADQLGLGKQSVGVYVSNGRKELEETMVDVHRRTSGGTEGKRVSLMEITNSGAWAPDPTFRANIVYTA